MATRVETDLNLIRDQLLLRRQKLQQASTRTQTDQLVHLLQEVDGALARMEDGSFGLCESCHETIEAERLLADPLVRFCVDHLSEPQRRALEEDLALAARIQAGLLPKPDITFGPWHVAYHYAAAGPVSGDYCDVVMNNGDVYLVVGDVSGKGVAASMLMANLHAMFRALIPTGLPVGQLVERASRLFCESTLPTQYATLVCARASACGEVEICNAGHVPPLLQRGGKVVKVETTGLPVGMFCDSGYTCRTEQLTPGDTLVAYTDGISEAVNASGAEFGDDRLHAILSDSERLSPKALVNACVRSVAEFRSGASQHDDETFVALRYSPEARS
jgi:sigma-B regulation protein RsbU (phosphoserine phosphatase)